MLNLVTTNQFKKDLKKANKQRKNIDVLSIIIDLLQYEHDLDEKYSDHSLTGNWKKHRECHISPDWLLIYQIDQGELRLVRLGSHSELFS